MYKPSLALKFTSDMQSIVDTMHNFHCCKIQFSFLHPPPLLLLSEAKILHFFLCLPSLPSLHPTPITVQGVSYRVHLCIIHKLYFRLALHQSGVSDSFFYKMVSGCNSTVETKLIIWLLEILSIDWFVFFCKESHMSSMLKICH